MVIKALGQIDLGVRGGGFFVPGDHVEVPAATAAELVALGVAEIVEGAGGVTRLSGIGPASAGQLAAAGVHTLADLATISDEDAGRLPGSLGKRVLESFRAAARELLDGGRLTRLSGIRPASAGQLAAAGVHTLADLATISDEDAGRLPGSLGKRVLESFRAAARELLDGVGDDS